MFRKIAEANYLDVAIFSFVNSGDDLTEAQEIADLRAEKIAESFTSKGVGIERIQTKAFLQEAKGRRSSRNGDKIEIYFKLID